MCGRMQVRCSRRVLLLLLMLMLVSLGPLLVYAHPSRWCL